MKPLISICVLTVAALATFNASGAVWDTSTSSTQIPKVSLSTGRLIFFYFPHCIINHPEAVVLTNDGPGVLDISAIGITNRNFSQIHTCGSTLGVGHSCNITVTWDRVPASGALVITDNGVGSSQSVSLQGADSCLK